MLDEGGASTLEHLLYVLEATGVAPPELARLQEVDCPYSMFHIWIAFTQLSATRSSNGFGPNRLRIKKLNLICVLAGLSLHQMKLIY